MQITTFLHIRTSRQDSKKTTTNKNKNQTHKYSTASQRNYYNITDPTALDVKMTIKVQHDQVTVYTPLKKIM